MKKNKPRYSLCQNIKYLIGKTLQVDKVIFIYFICFTILTIIQPFINIFFPRLLLLELMGENRGEQLVKILILFFLSAVFVNFFIIYIRGVYFPRMAKVRYSFQEKHYEKCMNTDFKNTENSKFLDDMQTSYRCLLRSDIGVEGLLHKLFQAPGSYITLLIYVAIIFKINIFIFLYLFLNIMILYILSFSTKKFEHGKKDVISKNERKSTYLYNIMYDFSYGKELRLFNLSSWIASMFKAYKDERLSIHKNIKWNSFKVSIIDIVLTILREGIIYGYLIYLVLDNRLSIADFTVYFAAIAGFITCLMSIMSDISYMRGENLNICDCRNFLESEDEINNEDTLDLPLAPYEIEFRNVSFKYPDSEYFIYQDLNLKIQKGEKLAIVGCNGSGKSTFVKLLSRLYEVTDGEILMNGINIKNFKKKDYYKLFSTVFQEVNTLAFSVAENVSLSTKEEINNDKLEDVLKKVGMEQKINSLKYGAYTAMQKIIDGEGINFSGGENLKVSIARALYKNGDISILDEPTAALDAIAESNIYENFNTITSDKTSIYISHRLSSTSFCDKIAMFEKGKIMEYGTHEELIAKKGEYYHMWSIQSRYYKEEIV